MRSFENIVRKFGKVHVTDKAKQDRVCSKFQKHQCNDPETCGREHCCVGCGQHGVADLTISHHYGG